MSWFSDLFHKRTTDWFFSQIPIEQTPGNVTYAQVNAGEEYLNVILKSMRIVDVRKGLSKFYATVHSHIELGHIDQGIANFNYVTTPGNLEKLDSSNLDRVVNLNRRLLGPVPYVGGDVTLEIGLFSIKEADLAAPFINLLTSMSSLGGVSFISAALPYVKPLEEGVKLLTGSSGDTILEIGYNTQMTEVQTGYYVVMRVDKDKVDVNNLVIDPKDYRLIDKKTKQSISDYPYMVFEISSSKTRNDWFNIPEVAVAYNQLRKLVKEREYNQAQDALRTFQSIVATSADMIQSDATALSAKVTADITALLNKTLTADEGSIEVKDLISYTLSDLQPSTVIEAFYQHGANNCATLGIIKLAIATYQIDGVFKSVNKNVAEGSYVVTLRNDKIIEITADELLRWGKASGFTLNQEAERQISERILEFAILCFAVVIKYNMTQDGLSEKESLYEINGKGINSDYAYLILGLAEADIEFLTPNNNGTLHPADYATHTAYLLYNNNHCVMATKDKFDEYGKLYSVNDFVKKHSSFLKPGKTCWAYILK